MDPEILAIMDALWKKCDMYKERDKKDKKKSIEDDLMGGVPAFNNMPVPKPNWNELNYVPTKKNVSMSEEEFEEAIVALALKNAKSGNLDLTHEYYKLQTDYISVVSPDRKAACENYIRTPYDNSNTTAVYGNFNQKLMIYAHGKWGAVFTPEEQTRVSKFGQIYMETLRQYEAEHGQFSYNNSKTGSKSILLNTLA
jgi:hypothetical protein